MSEQSLHEFGIVGESLSKGIILKEVVYEKKVKKQRGVSSFAGDMFEALGKTEIHKKTERDVNTNTIRAILETMYLHKDYFLSTKGNSNIPDDLTLVLDENGNFSVEEIIDFKYSLKACRGRENQAENSYKSIITLINILNHIIEHGTIGIMELLPNVDNRLNSKSAKRQMRLIEEIEENIRELDIRQKVKMSDKPKYVVMFPKNKVIGKQEQEWLKAQHINSPFEFDISHSMFATGDVQNAMSYVQ